ncbi:hypothetical protein N5C55_10385 [Pseudomonas otitidis]|uniref:hypothetical protein n=1 Tax=Metapseudomonas otitidis TaxID=319939 RepID=UPI002449732D|nr:MULTISPECIES: hypothetical protein [Pseudomonas]MDL5599809.1 hypothetical protein [Bacillus subtilis]MDH1107986.1 hypothetical protein [Pseudomonas otitidis]MDH1158574.1 hypothetical protein [Pseudomonas otitidis]MDH1167021.1 hypothetical protein [Pseudomonas otitidis]MEE1894192.1 hypothetical protein [Pseudomonas otitidis]
MKALTLLLAALLALPGLARAEAPLNYGMLVVSRERMQLATGCDVALYVQDRLIARLVQGQSVELNLPPGRVSVRLGLLDAAPCRAGMGVQEPQTITLQAGMVSRYELGMNDRGLYLIPSVPLP